MVLDTCTVIWLSGDQDRLSPRANAAIRLGRKHGRLAIADITLNEIALLAAKGRLPLHSSIDEYLRFLEATFVVLPITAEIALRANRFVPPFPNDPFDRLIAATAIVHRDKLITKDQKIFDSGEVDCVW